MNWLASVVVHCASWLVPSSLRTRWREEWLGELAATRARSWRFAAGAPRDALAFRRYHAYRLARRGTRNRAWQSDLTQTCRQLWRSPGYVAVVVMGLSLGIVATLSVLSMISTIRWGDPAGVVNRAGLRRLVAHEQREGFGEATVVGFPISVLRHLESDLPSSFTSVAGEELRPVTVRTKTEFSSTLGAYVSGDYFVTLGTRPALGRLLSKSDDRRDATAVVISHPLWQELFGGRLDVVGSRIEVSGNVMNIAGVAPPAFSGRFEPPGPGHDTRPRLWMPLATAGSFQPGGLIVTLRLSTPGAPDVPAPALDALRSALAVGAGSDIHRRTPVLQPVGASMARGDGWEFAGMSAVLLAGPLAVLAIACANVANMRLARGTSRIRELSVRAALGADTRQLVRLLAMESCILTALVLGVAWLGTRSALVAVSSAIGFEVQLDANAAVAAGILGAGSLVASGLIPAWLVVRRTGLLGLRHTFHAGSLGHSRLRNALVIAQVSASLVLLTVTSLAARSLQAVATSQAPVLSELAVADLNFASEGFTPEEARRFTSNVLARLADEPLAKAVGSSTASLFSATSVRYELADGPETPARTAGLTYVSPDWFGAMDIRARAGRLLRPGDSRNIVVVDETVASAISPGASAVGRTLRVRARPGQADTTDEYAQIVGVIPAPPADPGNMRPSGSIIRLMEPGGHTFVSLHVRTPQPETMVRRLHDIVASQRPRGPWTVIEPAEAKVRVTTNPIRAVAITAGALAAVALLLSVIGLAGVTAYVVSLRHREIGVRLALGGGSGEVVAMIVRQSGRLVAIGIGGGFVLSVPVGFLLRDGLVGVSPVAVGALAPPALVLIGVSLVAAGVPALRAARVNPIEVLRQD